MLVAANGQFRRFLLCCSLRRTCCRRVTMLNAPPSLDLLTPPRPCLTLPHPSLPLLSPLHSYVAHHLSHLSRLPPPASLSSTTLTTCAVSAARGWKTREAEMKSALPSASHDWSMSTTASTNCEMGGGEPARRSQSCATTCNVCNACNVCNEARDHSCATTCNVCNACNVCNEARDHSCATTCTGGAVSRGEDFGQ